MRLLFLSNYYPPFSLGGYELWCQEVGDALRARGHQVAVLTSRPPGKKPILDVDGNIHRALYLELEGGLPHTIGRLLWTREKRERENIAYLRRLVDELQPDVAVIWGMWNMPRSVPAYLETLLPGRVVYYFCDYWPSLPSAYVQRWQEPARNPYLNTAKKWLGKRFMKSLNNPLPALRFEQPICVSKAVRLELIRLGVPVKHATVLYGGIDTNQFKPTSHISTISKNEIRFVYVGRLVPDKGLHTVLEAMVQLSPTVCSRITLDVFGSGDTTYEAQLRQYVQKMGLDRNVRFRGFVNHADLPGLLNQYHALIFPSIWQEPFARTVLEGMACGLVVVGSTSGGTPEAVIDGKTGLTFPPGDSLALAAQLERLVAEPPLRATLAAQARAHVETHFTINRMVTDIETVLLSLPSSKNRLLTAQVGG